MVRSNPAYMGRSQDFSQLMGGEAARAAQPDVTRENGAVVNSGQLVALSAAVNQLNAHAGYDEFALTPAAQTDDLGQPLGEDQMRVALHSASGATVDTNVLWDLATLATA